MKPKGWETALGVVIGFVLFKRYARKPLRSLMVFSARGVMNAGERISAAGQEISHGWQDIVEEAKWEMDQRKESVRINEDTVMDAAACKMANYLHKAADTIDKLADKFDNPEEIIINEPFAFDDEEGTGHA